MATQWPNNIITFPYSGIATGFDIHPYHMSDVYLEISGIETSIGFNPLHIWSSITARISGIESGYAKTFANLGSGSGIYSSSSQSGVNLKSLIPGANITFTADTNAITINGSAGAAAQSGSTITMPETTTESGIAIMSGTTGRGFRNTNFQIIDDDLVPSTSGEKRIGNFKSPFSGVHSNQYYTTLKTTAVNGAAYTVNWNDGSSQIVTFAGGISGIVSLTLSNGVAGTSYALQTIQNPSGTTQVAWGTNVLWQHGISGIASQTGNALDLFTFWNNGTNYLGNAGYNFKTL